MQAIDRLRHEAADLMEKYSVPGMVLGVIVEGEALTAALGVNSTAHPLEVTETTLFQIGSTTKTVTATALVRLAERGDLALDDPVRSHVPELDLADDAVAAAVTIRDLLQHTAGWAGDLFVDTGDGDDAARRYLERMGALPQLTPLGELSVYNNAGFVVAARVIEVVTGVTYERAVADLVLEPLGMTESSFRPAEVMLGRFAVGHHVHPDGRVEIASPWPIPRGMNGAGGLSSSLVDQLRYARFHLGDGTGADGSAMLSPASMVEMQTPVAEFTNDRWFGLAWMVSDLDGTRQIAHGGTTNGQTSDFWLCPDRGVAFVSMTNASTGHLLNAELTALVHEELLGYTAPSVEPMVIDDPNALDEYLGRYVGSPNGDVHELRRDGDRLLFGLVDHGRFNEVFQGRPDAVPSAVEFYDTDRVIMRGGDLDGTKGGFLRDANGCITHLRMMRLLAKQEDTDRVVR